MLKKQECLLADRYFSGRSEGRARCNEGRSVLEVTEVCVKAFKGKKYFGTI